MRPDAAPDTSRRNFRYILPRIKWASFELQINFTWNEEPEGDDFFSFPSFWKKTPEFLGSFNQKERVCNALSFWFYPFRTLINVQDIVRLAFPGKHKLHHLSFPWTHESFCSIHQDMEYSNAPQSVLPGFCQTSGKLCFFSRKRSLESIDSVESYIIYNVRVP